MFNRWYPQNLFGLFLALLLVTIPAYAVKTQRASNYGGGHQIWFEAEDWDERIPDTDEFYEATDIPRRDVPGFREILKDKKGIFGEKFVVRKEIAEGGGRISYKFHIPSN